MEAEPEMNEHGPKMDRLEDAIIDTVAHAFHTLFRLPVSWQRGASEDDSGMDAPGSSPVYCEARLRGPIDGLGIVQMPGRTARGLAGLIAGRVWQDDQRIMADALGDLTETLLIGAVERAEAGGTTPAECGPPTVTVGGANAEDDAAGALVEANANTHRVRVSFESDCGPFVVQIEFSADDNEPHIHTAARAALCAC